MNTPATALLLVNQRAYKLPVHPTVVVCMDGCEPDYLAQAVAAGRMPWLQRTLARGVALRADCALPSFTNPNNLSIVTGVAPDEHGISGNYFLDRASGQAVMMNDPKWLRCPTLLAEASRAGLTVAVVTAKDKLRTLLGHGLQGICFSAECADAATLATHGIGDVLALVGKPLPAEVSAQALCAALNKAPGIDSALTRAQAAHTLQLPADRIGDVVVLADRFTVLGTTPSAHDLSGLDAPLRSHGGRGEQSVPLIVNRPAPLLDRQRRWRNFDVFDVALNYVQ